MALHPFLLDILSLPTLLTTSASIPICLFGSEEDGHPTSVRHEWEDHGGGQEAKNHRVASSIGRQGYQNGLGTPHGRLRCEES